MPREIESAKYYRNVIAQRNARRDFINEQLAGLDQKIRDLEAEYDQTTDDLRDIMDEAHGVYPDEFEALEPDDRPTPPLPRELDLSGESYR